MSDENGEKEATSESPSEAATLQRTVEAYRDTFDNGLTRLNDLEQRGNQLVRMNFLIFTVVLSATSVAASQTSFKFSEPAVQWGSVGLLWIFVGTIFAFFSMSSSSVPYGIDTSAAEGVTSRKVQEKELLYGLLQAYKTWVPNYESEIQSTRKWYDRAIFADFLGVVYLGIAAALVFSKQIWGIPQWVPILGFVIIGGLSMVYLRLRPLSGDEDG